VCALESRRERAEEYPERERRSGYDWQPRTPAARYRCRGGDDGEIGYERVELAVRAGVEGNLKALLQLPDEQAPFSGSGPQTLDDLLAVAVGSAERMPTRHIFSLARPTLSDPRLTGDRLAAASDGSG
jgi:hypothetical protein